MKNTFYSAYQNESLLYKTALTILLFFPLALLLGISPTEVVISSTSLLFLIHCIYTKNFSWLKQAWVKVFLLLWIYLCIRAFFTLNPKLAIHESLSFIRFMFFALVAQYWLLKKATARKALVITMLLTVMFGIMDGLSQFFIQVDFFNNHLNDDLHRINRLTAPSGKLNIGSDLMMLSFPVILYLLNLAQYTPKLLKKYGLYVLIALIIMFIPLTGERNSSLLMALGLIFLIILFKPARKALAVICISSLITLFIFLHHHPELNQRMTHTLARVVTSITDKSGTNKTLYSSLIQTDWNILRNNLWFGIGRKQFVVYCEQANPEEAVTKRDYNTCITNPQNIYLEWLCETGVIGTLIFLCIPFLWLREAYKNRKVFHKETTNIGVLIEILLKLWPLGITSSFFISWWGGPFWLMGGWLLASLQTTSQEQSSSKANKQFHD